MADNQKTMEIALRIKADAAQAKLALGEVQAQLEGVQATATKSNAAQVKSTRDVVAALAAKHGVTAEAIQDYAKQLVATQASAATEAQYIELLLTSTKVKMGMAVTNKELASTQRAVNLLRATGAISAEEETAAIAALSRAKILDIAVTREAALNSRASYSAFALLSDAATGQFSRSRREVAALANETGLLGKLMNPVALAITAVAVAVGAFGVAVYNREKDLLEFNKALAATGNFAGTTGLELQGVAMQVGASTGRYDDAKAAVLALAKSGDVLGSHLKDMATVAVNMAFLTGESIDKVVKDLIALQGDPTQAVVKLTGAMGLLTTAQFNQIAETQAQQGASAAAALAMKDLQDASDAARTKLVANAGVVIRAWDKFKTKLSDIGHAIASIGAQLSLAEQIADLQKKMAQQVPGGATYNMYQTQIAALKQRQIVDSYFAAGQEAANQAKQKHDQALAAALASDKQGEQGLQAQLKDINQKRLLALVGVVDPAVRDRVNATYDQQIRDAVKHANEQLPHGATAKAPKATVDHSAEQIAKAAAAAQDALTQALIAQQAALSPTAAIWAKYNATVEKANEDAAKAKLAHGANAQSIDAVRDAVVQGAAAVRDAALDQLTEKDRQAWEALRRSMESPIDAKIDDAIAKIQKLNEAMANGAGNADEYHKLLQQTGANSVTKLPHYEGVDASVGGIGSELAKNYQKQQEIEAAYLAQRQELKNKYRHDDAAQEEAYQSALATLDQNYANERNNIERSRGQLQLQTASSLFGQLATLSSSHNKKMATIGKAAAIAQTIINTYQSATEAYAAMASIPYIGPALGAAAAAVAIAAGLANVAAIRSQSVGGYQGGGWTGDAPVSKVVGVVHGREGVLSAPEVEMIGGEAGFNRLRRAIRGYASGGYVSPYASAPSPSDLGFSAPRMPSVNMRDFAANDDAHARQAPPPVHVFAVFDPAEIADKVMNSGPGHKVIVNVAGDNPMAIQGKWRR